MSEYHTIFIEKGMIRLSDGELDNCGFDEETKKTCAKIVTNLTDDGKRYYVKLSSGHMVNPFDTDFVRLTKRFSWLTVDQETFDLYCRFLRTGSQAALVQAERLM